MTDVKGMKVSKKVVVACVVFDTWKVVAPIEYLHDAGKIYLIHWVSQKHPERNSVYSDFFNQTVKMLAGTIGIENIYEVRTEVYDFRKVLATVLAILIDERSKGNEVFINISSGTSEFAAAATLAAMMVPGVRPFTVRTDKWMVSDDKVLKQMYYEKGTPVGQSRSVRDPEDLPIFKVPMPDRSLVIGLRLLSSHITEKKSTSYSSMIREFKRAGIWRDNDMERKIDQSDKMFYLRNFMDPWLENEWVMKESKRQIALTDMGKHVIEMFYAELPRLINQSIDNI
jgi:hypothetical protein